jgi:hypothetical protein
MHYIYLTHLDSFTALDNSNTEWSKAREAVGPTRWDDLLNRGNNAIIAPTCRTTPRHRASLPDSRQGTRGGQVAKDYAALFKQKNMNDSWNLYQGLIGNDLPLLIVSIPARNETDLVTADQGNNNTLGADVRALQAGAVALTRRFERHEGIIRPDLSYPPPASAAK